MLQSSLRKNSQRILLSLYMQRETKTSLLFTSVQIASQKYTCQRQMESRVHLLDLLFTNQISEISQQTKMTAYADMEWRSCLTFIDWFSDARSLVLRGTQKERKFETFFFLLDFLFIKDVEEALSFGYCSNSCGNKCFGV